MTRIFVSYSSHDRAVAERLCTALEACGNRCWIAPRDISPSREWAEEIIDGINLSSTMLLVLSSHSNASPQVRREVERAINKGLAVIPLRIENVLPTKSLEYFLSAQHWLDAYDGPLETAIPYLCRLVAQLAAERTVSDATQTAAGAAMSMLPEAAEPAWSEPQLRALETVLALYVGPVAAVIVRRAAQRQRDARALIATLAAELDLAAERTAFVQESTRRLQLC